MATKHVLQCNFQTCNHWIFHANYGETLFWIADQWGHYIKKQENIDYWRTCESDLVKNHLTNINFSSNRGLQSLNLMQNQTRKGLYVCKYAIHAWCSLLCVDYICTLRLLKYDVLKLRPVHTNIYKDNVSGYVCNHGSPSGERDTASPRGRYGERPQRDSVWRYIWKNTTCWPATAHDVTTGVPQYKCRREDTSSASSSEACVRSMAQSPGDAVSRSPLGEPWLHT